jgi:hypothetical protein
MNRSPDPVATVLRGSCHCGKIRVELATSMHPESFHPRGCDCSFCVKHGAAYVSDPDGTLSIRVAVPNGLSEYKQGSGTARCLLCRSCGVLLGAVFEDGGRRYGTINVRCLDDVVFGASETVSPQRLSVEEKKARWRRLWTPDVEIVGG